MIFYGLSAVCQLIRWLVIVNVFNWPTKYAARVGPAAKPRKRKKSLTVWQRHVVNVFSIAKIKTEPQERALNKHTPSGLDGRWLHSVNLSLSSVSPPDFPLCSPELLAFYLVSKIEFKSSQNINRAITCLNSGFAALLTMA